jgi:hypothetical protein
VVLWKHGDGKIHSLWFKLYLIFHKKKEEDKEFHVHKKKKQSSTCHVLGQLIDPTDKNKKSYLPFL